MSDAPEQKIPLRPLSRKQRRVLGVLIEKAFTVPDQYPLTLKGATTACNQKNNRDPITNYDEDDVHGSLEELMELGFVGCVFTETGRTERYRHYLRQNSGLTSPQIAILGELLLRGRQQMGELRTHASRMVAIETLEKLRDEVQSLIDLELVRANGPLERRGIEVDHNLYPAGENHEPLSAYVENDRADDDDERAPVSAFRMNASGSPQTFAASATSRVSEDRVASLEQLVQELRSEVNSIREDFRSLQDRFDDLRRQLGG